MVMSFNCVHRKFLQKNCCFRRQSRNKLAYGFSFHRPARPSTQFRSPTLKQTSSRLTSWHRFKLVTKSELAFSRHEIKLSHKQYQRCHVPQTKDKNKTTKSHVTRDFLRHLSRNSLVEVCRVPNSTSRPLWHYV